MSDHGALPQSGAYPERTQRRPSPVEKILLNLAYPLQSMLPRPSVSSIAARVDASRAAAKDPGKELQALRYELRKSGLLDDLVARALALAAKTAAAFAMKPDDLQIAAAWLLIHEQGVELQSVIGRPMACALAASVVALGGVTVHVIVPGSHVARRDSAAMRPVFAALGLSVSHVDEQSTPEQRKEAYVCDVVYCVQRELALDYLRDRLVLKGRPKAVRLRTELLTMPVPRTRHLLLTGLQFAIIDEADVVMVDAVQSPVSISADSESSQEVRWLAEALQLAGRLKEATDYRIHEEKFVELTGAGAASLSELARPLSGIWQGGERREEIVTLALVASRVMQKDKHYTVAGPALQVDPQVLRMYARQQVPAMRILRLLLELKDGCTPTATRETRARVAYQRFFRGYLRSGAIASDTCGLGAEFWKIYRLRLARLRDPSPRLWVSLSDRLVADREALAQSVMARVSELRGRGIPVLIVTRNQAACSLWSESFAKAGLEHQCLMGAQDEKEAAAFGGAAAPGRITVAPHFVARGCAVGRAEGTEKLGGLRIIFVQLLPTTRHVNSLVTRTLPAGVPGSVQRILALDDEILINYAPAWWRHRRLAPTHGLMLRYSQWRFGHDNRIGRSELLRVDDYLGDLLAFSGGAE